MFFFLIESKDSSHSNFLVFSKAFDTVEHEILCKKLECYGIRGQMLSWIESYLSDRYQYVDISGIKSPNSEIGKEMPQRSILWPLLFLFYTLMICTNILS